MPVLGDKQGEHFMGDMDCLLVFAGLEIVAVCLGKTLAEYRRE